MIFDFFDSKFDSRRKALKWWWWRALCGIMLLWISYLFILPFAEWLMPLNDKKATTIYGAFWGKTLTKDLFLPLKAGWNWFWLYIFHEPRHFVWSSFFAWKLPLVPTFFFFMYEFWLFVLNPYTMSDQTFGSGHEARDYEVKKMGLFDGKFLFLGTYGPSKKKLKLPDTRSVFCIGMPGSGKTMGVVVPAILEMNNASLIINDPKGELAKLTSGHRAQKGPVFMMNWAGVDDPKKGIRWPCWNPIGGGNLPPLHAGREGYIDTLISFLIPDGPTGADPYWAKAGRGCLTGLTGYLCGKVEQAKANDYFVSRLNEGGLDDEDYDVLLSYYKAMRDFPEVLSAIQNAENKTITKENYLPIGKWDPLPQSWQGASDACFAMLLDIITNSQIRINESLAERRRMGDPSVMMTDAWKILLDDIVLETAYYGYGRRTLLELNQISSLPDKQRGSVISMALSGINLFKNAAVRTRTSMNDFNYDQLRGIKDPDTGEYQPVTVYMSVPYEDLNSSILLSTLFINMATGYLMEHGPNDGTVGPYPMGFILDEFQHMPSLQSISDGIVFGRAKQNMFLVSVQDWHQISSKYGQETTDVILSSSAVKIVKRQNNHETRNALLKGLPKLTKVVHSYSENISRLGPFWGAGNMKKSMYNFYHERSHKIKIQADTVIGGAGILSMAIDKQLVIYAGYLRLPIRADTPLCYKVSPYKDMTQIPPAPQMPDYILHDERIEDAISSVQING